MMSKKKEILFSEFNPTNKTSWLQKVKQDLKDKSITLLNTQLSEDIEISPFFNIEDIENLSSLNIFDITSKKSKPSQWVNLERIYVEDENSANQMAQASLNAGADGIIFNLSKKSSLDLEKLLNNILLNYCIISFEGVSLGQSFAEKYLIHLKNKQYNTNHLGGHYLIPSSPSNNTNHTDELSSWFVQNTIKIPLKITLEITYPDHNLSDYIAQTLYNATEWISWFHNKYHISHKAIFNSFGFSITLRNNLFLEIAKLKVLRTLYYGLAFMYNIHEDDIQHLFIHTNTSSTLNTAHADNIMISNTTQAISAILGEANAITVTPHQNSTLGKRIARNVSNILREEAYFDKTQNPTSGSYFFEKLFDQVAHKSWTKFQELIKKHSLV